MKLIRLIAVLSALQILFGFGFSVINGNIAILVNLFLSALIFLVGYKSSFFRFTSKKIRIMIPLALLLFWHSRGQTLVGLSVNLLQVLSIFMIIGLRWDVINEIKYVFLKIFAFVSALSLFFWVLYLAGIDVLPSFTIGYSGIYELQNHVVFVETTDKMFKRFQSVFVEPGLYGMLCVVSLILNRFKKDKKTLIYLLSALFSLSLSAYLLLVVAFFYHLMVFKRIKLYSVIIAIGCFVGLCVFFVNYKDGDNIINKAIIFRLQLDDDNKVIAYNRATDFFEDFYEKEVKGDVMIYGIGSENYKNKHFENSVDVRAYITLDGLFGLLLFVLFYFMTLLYSRVNKMTILLLGVFLIIFYRGFVFSLCYGGILLFIISIFSFSNKLVSIKRTQVINNENIICTSK